MGAIFVKQVTRRKRGIGQSIPRATSKARCAGAGTTAKGRFRHEKERQEESITENADKNQETQTQKTYLHPT